MNYEGASLAPIDYCCPCPTKSKVYLKESHYSCVLCSKDFPIINDIPIFIDEENSVFLIQDYLDNSQYRGVDPSQHSNAIKRLYRTYAMMVMDSQIVPRRGFDAAAAITYVGKLRKNPRILVVGAGTSVYDSPYTIIYTDVAFGGRVSCICDAQGLPYPSESFDLVIAVAILEHVADPYRCVSEMHRVLKSDGFVYSSTPFMQPVHMGAYDFTRFTPLGHRRLHRYFDEVKVGMALGPGSVLAWVVRYYLLSFSDNHQYRRIARALAVLLTLPLRWSDVFFRSKAGALDIAGGTNFFGCKRASPVSDREILRTYRGLDSRA